jgi:hypothetical protein
VVARHASRIRPACQPEAGQRYAGQADAELLERLPPGGCLGQCLGQFIEFAIHTFPFILLLPLFCSV